MASILVVCTGNVCRSPAAEAFLRRALTERLGPGAPTVASAGTAAWVGSAPTPESVRASKELGVDTSGHVARSLTAAMIEEAELIVAMASVHAGIVVDTVPGAGARTFTLKHLVRLLEQETTAAGGLGAAVAIAAARRSAGSRADPFDDDVADPFSMPMERYRAMAWELDEWTERLATALFGPVAAEAAGSGV